jgi:hypothetical protein
MRATKPNSPAASAKLRCDQCVSGRPTLAGVLQASRSIARRSRRGKNAWSPGARRSVQRGVQAALPITFTHAPDGGWILFDFLAQQHDALRWLGALQQDLRAACNLPGRLTIPQQRLQAARVRRFQNKFIGLSTAHGSVLLACFCLGLNLAQAVHPDK